MHRNETLRWLKNAPHVEFVEIDYPTLIRDAPTAVASLVEFLEPERLPTAEKMTAVIDASLYRRRGSAS